MTENNGRFLSTSIILLTLALLYTAPVSAQTLHPEFLFEKNRVVASYALLEEEVEIDDSDDLDAVKDEVADWVYRVGDEWSKKVLARRDLRNKKLKFVEELRRTAEATAKVAKGTGFYLGQFNGFHLIATNYHVHIRLVTEPEDYKEIEFPFLDLSFNSGRTFGAWLEIDLALFAISVESKWDRKILQSVAKNFSFDYPITRNQKLLTVGFGRAKNHYSDMVGTWDSDCKVFSGDNEFKIKYGPDEKGKTVGTWAFAVGCDASDGDSGSPVVTRDTGDIIGLLWGVAPKTPIAQSSQSLDNMIKENSPAIWKNLNYAVPAAKIKEFLLEKIKSGAITDKVERKTILAFLGEDSSS